MKVLMAGSGVLLALFLVAHMLGNLEMFGGPNAMNGYAELLRVWPPLLPIARVGLLVLAIIHIGTSIKLARANRAARPLGYAQRRNRITTVAARAMLASGVVVLIFVVLHILHFTVRITPAYKHLVDAQGRHDVHGMVMDAFGRAPVAAFYIVSMLLLGLHLSHGVASALQSLGVNHPRYGGALRRLGPAFAIVIVAGFVAVPISIFFGLVRPGGGH
jgi:succinate dehydrogenase / fumarate reductase cytochrome b subunit